MNAGHSPAPILIRHGEKRIEKIGPGSGPVLGLLPSARYSAGSVKIDGPDTLVLYSDGVNEAANEAEEEFGEERVKEIIAHAQDPEPAGIVRPDHQPRGRVRERRARPRTTAR